MSVIENITKNPMVKKLLLGQLKSAFKDNGIKLITIKLDDKGELNFEVYNEPQKVMPEVDFLTLINDL